jgi:hypothetical protein
MTETHPILTSFGVTKRRTFPLILVIGREANTDLPIGKGDGPYDFRLFPRAGFWNNAYGLLAKSVGRKCGGLKDICERNESSPIIFGNCLPIGIKNEVTNKYPLRKAVSENEKREHVRRLFSLGELVSRVEMVIMSGVKDDVFLASREVVLSECRIQGKQIVQVPFFYGGNRKAIERELAEFDEGRACVKLQAIASGFLDCCDA